MKRGTLKQALTASLRNTDACLAGAVVVIALFLVARSMGLYPCVSDESAYSLYARLAPFRDSVLPNYLYFWIYRTTNLCGDGFLGCARLLNVVFFVSAAPFIYLLGKRVTGDRTALLVAVVSLLGPINTFTAYFMPESLYFLAFWVFSYFALGTTNEHRILRWLGLGVLFGVAALVKPHALFLLPALAVYLFIVQRHCVAGRPGAARPVNYAAFFVSAMATKLLIGFVLAGSAGLTLFGTYYKAYAPGSAAAPTHYLALAGLAFDNLQGHVLALALLFPVAVAQLILAAQYFLRRPADRGHAAIDTMALYAALVLAGLLVVTALFTASAAASSAYESNARLHMRYYDFALPLLLLLAASQVSLDSIGSSLRSRALVGVPLGAAIVYAGSTQLAPFTPNLIDSPELRGFAGDARVFFVLGGLSCLCLALWVYAARAGARAFVYLFMPLAVVVSAYQANVELRLNQFADAYNRAGVFTRHYLAKDESAKLVMAGTDTARLMLALLSLDSPMASYQTLAQGAAYDVSKFPIGKEWLLLIGEHALPENTYYQIPMDGFTLVRVAAATTVDFRQSAWHGVVAGIRGLYPAEPWGAWSSGKQVSIEFLQPLPDIFTLRLVAGAFGPNAGKEFVARVGDSAAGFTLGTTPGPISIELQNPRRASTLTIEVPLPASPRELGLSTDERQLGIGLAGLRIEAR